MSDPIPTVFIPALLCDDALYREVITELGDLIAAQVMLSPLTVMADSVADVLSRAPERFVLVGTSYGGSLAMAVAIAAPERIMGLWLMGCDPGPLDVAELAAGLAATPDAVIDMLAGIIVEQDDTASVAEFRAMAGRVGGPAGAAEATALTTRGDLTPKLGRLTMPALVLWGENDVPVPVAIGRALADALPDAEFAAIAGCGHLPTLERPSQSAALFVGLLDRVTRTSVRA